MTLVETSLMPTDRDRILSLEERVSTLEHRLADYEASRPKRRGKQVTVSEQGVCGIDPTRDSATCPDAGVYRNQQGCKGTACDRKTKEYYREYRREKRSETPVTIEA